MPILVGFLWALGGALVTLVGLVIWAASQEPSGAASRPSRQAPDESLVTAARIKELEKDLEHQSDLAQYVDTDIATRMLIVAGSAAQRAKFGHADYSALRPLLAPQGDWVILVKPQFEAGREWVAKGGIVRDPHAHELACAKVANTLHAAGFSTELMDSPILGAEGNREFLLHGRASSR